jgi:hypothetical protein
MQWSRKYEQETVNEGFKRNKKRWHCTWFQVFNLRSQIGEESDKWENLCA